MPQSHGFFVIARPINGADLIEKKLYAGEAI
jgi:hypothetical protein